MKINQHQNGMYINSMVFYNEAWASEPVIMFDLEQWYHENGGSALSEEDVFVQAVKLFGKDGDQRMLCKVAYAIPQITCLEG